MLRHFRRSTKYKWRNHNYPQRKNKVTTKFHTYEPIQPHPQVHGKDHCQRNTTKRRTTYQISSQIRKTINSLSRLIPNYLRDRTFEIRIDDTTSTERKVGALQGSTLAPTLYNTSLIPKQTDIARYTSMRTTQRKQQLLQ